MAIEIRNYKNFMNVKYVNGETETISLRNDDLLKKKVFDGNLKEIEIGNGVKKICERAFMDCTSLTTITLPSSLKRIECNTFVGCTSLQEIIIPNTLLNVVCKLDARGVSEITLHKPSSDELIEYLQKGFAMDLYFEGDY